MTFPWVKSAVEEGKLALHGWYFDLQSGELLEYDADSQAFRPLVGHPHVGGRHERNALSFRG